ncbi:hypothetical protein [Roseovarius indicus]|nr:hypothetical protein [Roseovarius indicus]QEW26710.1 hypothetical protein RIdsm_02512 [Roseovarius indicus]SFD61271.1 hypothetical protein SAMN04488031_101830 [Roseovarius indicus]
MISHFRTVTFHCVDRVIAGEADNLDESNDIWWDRERGEVFNRYNSDRMKLVDMGGGRSQYSDFTDEEYFRICLHATGVGMAQSLFMSMNPHLAA